MRVPGIWLVFLLVAVIQLTSCSKAGPAGRSDNDPAADSAITRQDAASAVLLTDLSYGTDARQKMDVSLVARRDLHTPFVILLHGGAWAEGDKKDLATTVTFFSGQGINVANVNYRLTNKSTGSVRWTGILSDVAAAVRYLRGKAPGIITRPKDFVLFGFSAGAHLSLLHGYSYDSNSLVAAVIGFGTPTKFNDIAWKANPFLGIARSVLPPLTGQSFSTDTGSVILKKLSPYFSPGFKPTLLVHGDQDNVVPYSQSVLMDSKLRAAGIPTTFITLPHSGHSGEGASASDYSNALNACAAWVKQYSH